MVTPVRFASRHPASNRISGISARRGVVNRHTPFSVRIGTWADKGGSPGTSTRTFSRPLITVAATCSARLARLLQRLHVRHIAIPPSPNDLGGTCSSVTTLPSSTPCSVKGVRQIGHLLLPRAKRRNLLAFSLTSPSRRQPESPSSPWTRSPAGDRVTRSDLPPPVLPPSTVTQAAASSSPPGAVGNRPCTAHAIAPMRINPNVTFR